jgi:hypothetical protein
MNSLDQLLEFLDRLRTSSISYRLECNRLPPDSAIMVIVASPSKYWEIEFFADGRIEVQTFCPSSDIDAMTLEAVTEAVVRDVNG